MMEAMMANFQGKVIRRDPKPMSSVVAQKAVTRIRPMAQDPGEVQTQQIYSCQELEAAASGAKDKRGAAAKLRLAQRAQAQVAAVDRKAAELVRTHNEVNRLAVERGRMQDLPYLEELVDSMRSKSSPLGGKGARQQRKLLEELMRETERRNSGALTDLISKVCNCSHVKRKQAADWFILSGLNEATEYILYKSKAKDPQGNANDYGFVIVCHNKIPDASRSQAILSIMQRGEYVEAMLIFTCLECLQNFELANLLLVRVQQREHEERVEYSASKHSSLLNNLLDLEDDLAAFAETNGASKAVKRGQGMTSFELQGPISQSPEPVLSLVLAIAESTTQLLKSIGEALKPPPKPLPAAAEEKQDVPAVPEEKQEKQDEPAVAEEK